MGNCSIEKNFWINSAKYSVQVKINNNTAKQNSNYTSFRIVFTSMEAISEGQRYAVRLMHTYSVGNYSYDGETN